MDDGSAEVLFGGGMTFPFYDGTYEHLFQNANGNVTFDAGDATSRPISDEHFAVPRVAPCFTDLNPETGGTVWYLQLDDRLVVTWAGVPRFRSTEMNTLQLELHVDGTIRFSYLELSGFDSITGFPQGTEWRRTSRTPTWLNQAAPGTTTGRYHSADTNRDHAISLQEALRVIQFMNPAALPL